MEAFLNVLPNLSIGVICIGALVTVVYWFLAELRYIGERHERSMLEREKALRDVETDVRRNLTEVLTKATISMDSNSRVLGRVVNQMDRQK